MPQVINGLIKVHTVQGVTLILGGIAANSFVAASLLQPIKWHMKTQEVPEENPEPVDKPNNEDKTQTKIDLKRSGEFDLYFFLPPHAFFSIPSRNQTQDFRRL